MASFSQTYARRQDEIRSLTLMFCKVNSDSADEDMAYPLPEERFPCRLSNQTPVPGCDHDMCASQLTVPLGGFWVRVNRHLAFRSVQQWPDLYHPFAFASVHETVDERVHVCASVCVWECALFLIFVFTGKRIFGYLCGCTKPLHPLGHKFYGLKCSLLGKT